MFVRSIHRIPSVMRLTLSGRRSSLFVSLSENNRRCISSVEAVVIEQQQSSPILNAAGEVSLKALGLGSNYTPVGWVQTLLEFIHADIGLDWCPTIAACALTFRLALFPIVLKSQRTAARMRTYMPKVIALQDKIKDARMRADHIETINLSVEMMDFLKKNKIKPMQNAVFTLIQAPVFFSTFLAIRGLCTFPLDSLLTGGMLWFPNLYEADPYYGLPILTAITMACTMELGFHNGATPIQPAAKLLLRFLPIVSIPFLCKFSSGLVFYWSVTNLISLGQVMIVNWKPLKKVFNIPDVKSIEAGTGGSKRSFLKDIKDSWKSTKLIAEVEDRKKLDEKRFRQAGIDTLIPTYTSDPTKKKL